MTGGQLSRSVIDLLLVAQILLSRSALAAEHYDTSSLPRVASSRGTAFIQTDTSPADIVTEVVPAAGRNLALGVYDPARAYSTSAQLRIEHIFISWRSPDTSGLETQVRDANEHRRQIMVTIEPFTPAEDWVSGGEHLLAAAAAGVHDSRIDAICRRLASARERPLVRWGHEMEDPTGRYPWARADARGYILAYRHVVERCRLSAPGALFVWSPKGDPNLAAYYPGSAWVDRVGLAVWGHERADQLWFGGARDFRGAVTEKYARVASFGKPVVIAEIGFTGGTLYRGRWQQELLATLRSAEAFPLLTAIVLFADAEPWPWPSGLGKPDWRIGAAEVLTGVRSAQALPAAGFPAAIRSRDHLAAVVR